MRVSGLDVCFICCRGNPSLFATEVSGLDVDYHGTRTGEKKVKLHFTAWPLFCDIFSVNSLFFEIALLSSHARG